MTDEQQTSQNRRAQRSSTLMVATLDIAGRSLRVTLRNLSSDGARVEGSQLPVEGTELLFRKGELALPGSVIWTEKNQAGIRFAEKLDPAIVLNHVPAPRARDTATEKYRRPGLAPRALTNEERALARRWIPGGPAPSVES